MTWDAPLAPPVDLVVQEQSPHELVLPVEEQEKPHHLIDLQQGIVYIAVPPERYGSAWEPDPEAQANE